MLTTGTCDSAPKISQTRRKIGRVGTIFGTSGLAPFGCGLLVGSDSIWQIGIFFYFLGFIVLCTTQIVGHLDEYQ